jgi:hypothetical protein
MEKNEPEEEGSRWRGLVKFGSLVGASAPWLLLGYMLVNATRPAAEMTGFSGYVSNPQS